MAKMMATPPKYLPSQWHTSNTLSYSQAEGERARAEHLRAECERLRQETSTITGRTQAANAHKFTQHIQDIQFWKAELENSLSHNQAETDLLLGDKERLEEALRATRMPLETANSCLGYRQNRVGIDNVHDQVEIELHNEVLVLQKIQEMLQRMLDHTTEQVRLLRSAKYKLNKDLTDKLSALGIDDTCHEISDSTQGIGFSTQDVVKIQSTSVSLEEWAFSSNNNIQAAESQRQASSTLRGQIEALLHQTQYDIDNQRTLVNLEFCKRISEISTTKTRLEEHLVKVVSEIGEMEANIHCMEEAISAMAPPMMLSQTRLDLRSSRPHRELVRDPIQYGLVGEVAQISDSVDALRGRLVDSEAALKGLVRSQLSLEEDIGVKTTSLAIDRDHCMALRRQMDN